MADPDLFCSVRFGFQVSCDGDDNLDYVVAVEGTVLALVEPDQDDENADFAEVEVGRLTAFVTQTTRATNDGLSLIDIRDAHSSTLEGVYATLFDVKTDEPREELGIEPLWEGLLYLDRIEVDPEYRERGGATKALEAAIRTFCPNGVIAAHPGGMGLSDAELRESDFVKIAGADVIFRDNASRSPYRKPEDHE